MDYIMNGRVVSEGEVMRKGAGQKMSRPRKPEASFHKGFRVEGHPPGAMEEAEKKCKEECAAYVTYPIGKPPVAFNEAYWRNNHKKRPVRAKPYELQDAANVCAELARKAGWLDVVVVEVKKTVRES